MTNKEVIQLFAKYEPELLVEVFDDFYVMGWNDGAGDRDSDIIGIHRKNWLNETYEENMIFLKKDVDRLMNEMNTKVLETESEYKKLKELNTPKKPIAHYYNEEKTYVKHTCPNCGHGDLGKVDFRNLAYQHKFCNKCGQKFDWSEEE